MATSPTVLASAPAATSPVPASAPEAAKFPVVPLLLTAVLSAALATAGLGGGFYYLVRSGRISQFGTATHKAEVVAQPATHLIVLEPLLVNLADSGGASYLRIALTLRVVDAPGKKESAPKEGKAKAGESATEVVAPVRDTLLAVLGRQTSDQLLADEGKEHLKAALKAALAEHNSNLKVTDVFFTDFLVQR